MPSEMHPQLLPDRCPLTRPTACGARCACGPGLSLALWRSASMCPYPLCEMDGAGGISTARPCAVRGAAGGASIAPNLCKQASELVLAPQY